MSWGAKRRLIISAIGIAIILILLGFFSVKTFYKPGSCTDGKQNQGEAGVDCGGPCARFCANQAIELLIHWRRAFSVSNGNYNAVAYLENKNLRSGIQEIPYVFKLYDSKSILIAERTGSASIPPHQVVPIFEPNISTGFRAPARVEFEFDSVPVWTFVSGNIPDVRIVGQSTVTNVQSSPLLTAEVFNGSKQTLKDFKVVAIVYDGFGNAQQASQTVVDSLGPQATAHVSFSWPNPFNFTPERIEIVPKLYPGINY